MIRLVGGYPIGGAFFKRASRFVESSVTARRDFLAGMAWR
jgi:hypothetical protein